MKTNIPIFRAKRLYSDEYVFGVPRQDSKGTYEMIINVVEDGIFGVIQRYIKVDTISIHFPDMIDSQGNKIFASLQEDGKGGDIITDGEYDFVVIFNGNKFDLMFVEDNTFTKFNEWEDWNLFNKKGVKK